MYEYMGRGDQRPDDGDRKRELAVGTDGGGKSGGGTSGIDGALVRGKREQGGDDRGDLAEVNL